MKKSELLEIAATIYEEMLDGESDDSIMSTHHLDEETFQAAKKLMLENKGAEIRGKSREQHYVEYCMEQDHTMRVLDTLVNGLDSARQYNAVVGALRLRSEIIDKKVTKGFEFGVIRKEPERKEIIGGVIVADMTDDDLRKSIVTSVKSTAAMMKRFGEKDIMSLPTGELHYGEGITIEAEGEEAEETAEKPHELKGKRRRMRERRA